MASPPVGALEQRLEPPQPNAPTVEPAPPAESVEPANSLLAGMIGAGTESLLDLFLSGRAEPPSPEVPGFSGFGLAALGPPSLSALGFTRPAVGPAGAESTQTQLVAGLPIESPTSAQTPPDATMSRVPPTTTPAKLSIPQSLSASAVAAIDADAKRLSREVVSTFPNRTRILDIFDTWDSRDRALSGPSSTTPHLDALCAALQAQRLSTTTTALDMVWHVIHASSTSGQLFDSLVTRSARYGSFQPGPPLRSFWQTEATKADELRLLVLAGKYDEVQEALTAVDDPTNRDDIVLELVRYLDDATLVAVADHQRGRDLLERLYDELRAGKASRDERVQAARIETARVHTVTPEKFGKAIASGDLRVFPYRRGGFSATAAIPWASFVGDGKIFVRMNMNVRTNPTFDQDTATLPLDVFTAKGMILAADQIIGVRDYDEGGRLEYVPALRLVALKHEGRTHTFEKMGEVATLALGVVAGSAAAVGRGAQILLWTERAAIGLGVLGSVISENRGWFIKRFGDSGREFVEAVEIVNSAVALFGIIRMATSLPSLVIRLRQGLHGLRKSAAGIEPVLTAKQRELVRTSTTQADDLARTLEEIEQAKAKATAGSVKGSGSKGSGGGGSVGMVETLEAAPGGAVGTGKKPITVPATGQPPPAPSIAERGGWGSGWGGQYPPGWSGGKSTTHHAPPVPEKTMPTPSAPRQVPKPTGEGAEATSPYSGYWVPQTAHPANLPAQRVAAASTRGPAAPTSVPASPPRDPLLLPGAKLPKGLVGDPPPTDPDKRLPPPEGTPADEIKGDLPSKEKIQEPSPPEGSRELRLSEKERIQSNQRALDDLEARIGALAGTESPDDLVRDLDAINSHSPDAAKRIRQLADRVRRWEGAHPAPALPGIAELTQESEAARRATLGAEAERLEANQMQGSSGEATVMDEILSGQPIPELGVPVKLLGSQVYIRTSTGPRKVDHLVQLPTGEIVALEVKTGGAVRSRYQLDADYALSKTGGVIVGGGAPGMAGPIKPIRTVVLER
jgi:hypothetical protein